MGRPLWLRAGALALGLDYAKVTLHAGALALDLDCTWVTLRAGALALDGPSLESNGMHRQTRAWGSACLRFLSPFQSTHGLDKGEGPRG